MADETTSTETAETAETTDAQTERRSSAEQDQLGEAGKKALEAERRNARNAAKERDALAAKLKEIEDRDKSEAEKFADRIAVAESTVAQLPMMVADNLRTHLVALHNIPANDAELFLTASDPELLLKQVTRLLERGEEQANQRKKNGLHVPREGTSTNPAENDELATARALFGGGG